MDNPATSEEVLFDFLLKVRSLDYVTTKTVLGHAPGCPGEDAPMDKKVAYWVKRCYIESLKLRGYTAEGIKMFDDKNIPDPLDKYYAVYPDMKCKMCIVPGAMDISIRAYNRTELFSDAPINAELIISGSGKFTIVVQPRDVNSSIDVNDIFNNEVKVYRGTWSYDSKDGTKCNSSSNLPPELLVKLKEAVCYAVDSSVQITLVKINSGLFVANSAVSLHVEKDAKES